MSLNKSLLAALATVAVLAAPTLAFAQSASAPAAVKPAPAAMPAPAPAAPAPAAAAASSDGKIAWYGKRFAGRKTASGQRFNPGAMTMAHKTLPFGSRVKVTNTANKRSVVVRVNDRGPTTPDRIGDVSQAAARKLGMLRSGVANATLEVVGSK
jgi:rare lipoprotein A